MGVENKEPPGRKCRSGLPGRTIYYHLGTVRGINLAIKRVQLHKELRSLRICSSLTLGQMELEDSNTTLEEGVHGAVHSP